MGLILIVIGSCASAFGDTEETRSDLIESARDQKEANLSPDSPPPAERRFISVETSLPYRLITGEVNGFSLGLGNLVPGTGFAAGPSYRRSDLWGGRLTLRVQTRAAANHSYLGRVELILPDLLGGQGFVEFSTTDRNISQMPYYGPGPDSHKTGRSNYRMEDTNIEVRPGFHVYKGLRAKLIGSWLGVNTGPGQSSAFIS